MFSDPVVGDNFFGRQEVIDLLVKRARALKSGYRQNVAIIGHQQLGKTSVLRHFLHIFRDEQILPIYVEIKFQALDYFVDQFARALLYQVLIPSGQAQPTDTLPKLMELASTRIPKTVSRIAEISLKLKQRHAEEAYNMLFELTQVLKQETGMSAIVILDEFHRLGEFGIRNAFSDFGKRIMVQKDTMYILSSSSFSQSRKILAEKLALLFGHFERLYLESFDFETSFHFIREKMSPVTVPDAMQSFIVSITDGHPFVLENVVSRLKEISGYRNETMMSRETLAEAFLKLFYESQGVLHQYFSKLISPWTGVASRGSHVLILSAIAQGKNRLRDIASSINRGLRETSSQLEELIAAELLVKNGVFYRFHNKTFRFWLNEVYRMKELSLLGMQDKSDSFLRRMGDLLDEETSLIGSDVSERVLTLMRAFDNDLVELGEKKRKLPHFSEILRADGAVVKEGSNASAGDLIAKGHGRCWVCKITQEKATERSVMDLVRGYPDKKGTNTKVLVALNGLDENAKLLAKEKRVLTLGLSRLNLLMDLYGKSPIIR